MMLEQQAKGFDITQESDTEKIDLMVSSHLDLV